MSLGRQDECMRDVTPHDLSTVLMKNPHVSRASESDV